MKSLTKLTKKFVATLTSIAIVIACLCAVCFVSQKALSAEQDVYEKHAQGEVIVWLESAAYPTDTTVLNYAQENNIDITNQIMSQVNDFTNSYDCQTLACFVANDEIQNMVSNDSSSITVKNPVINAQTPLIERVVIVKFDESKKSMSDMISELKKNPIVSCAEPNYQYTTESVQDLTPYQYAYDSKSSDSTDQDNTHNKSGMNVENWDVKDNVSADDKVVCAVFDSGVDYNHPDIPLAYDVYGDLSDIAPGGMYGYNAAVDPATEPELAKDPIDNCPYTHGHGTHCAGSVAAKWSSDYSNKSTGVSGAASKIYILPVRGVNYTDGAFSSAAFVRANAYYIAAKQTKNLNIKVASNSWGGATSSTIDDKAVTKAGESGIITVFASGNSTINTDRTKQTSTTVANNPYAIVVDSTNETGNFSVFSNYGVRTTDVCAPGTNILSTVPTEKFTTADGNEICFQASNFQFLEDGEYSMIDNFESESNMTDTQDTNSESDAESSAESNTTESNSESNATNLKYWKDEACSIPADIVGTSTEQKGYQSNKAAFISKDGSSSIYVTGDLSKYCKAASDVNNFVFMYNSDTLQGQTDNAVFCSVTDLNTNEEIASVNFSSANMYYSSVSIPVANISNSDNAKLKIDFSFRNQDRVKTVNNFYIDNVCIAYAQQPYNYMSGTSMSTPACSGVVTYIAASHPNEDTKKIVARIKGGTSQKTSTLKEKCYSGGIVDSTRSNSSNPDVDLDPVVINATVASVNNGVTTINLYGYFLGDSNTSVSINGQSASSVVASTYQDMNVLTCTFDQSISGEYKITVDKAGKSLTRYYDLGDSDTVLETLPQPPYNDQQFYTYYSSFLCFSYGLSDDMLLIMCANEEHQTAYYMYDFNNASWKKTTAIEQILAKISDKGYTGELLIVEKNILYFQILKDDKCCGIYRYDIYNDKEIDYVLFDDTQNSDDESSINKAALAFANGDDLYLLPSIADSDAHQIFVYNYQSNKLNKVSDSINIGKMPSVYNNGQDKYIFIDNLEHVANPKAEFCGEVYDATINTQGASATKLDIIAFPEEAKQYNSDYTCGHNVYDGKIVMTGPVLYESTANSVESSYVTCDSYLLDINSKTTNRLDKVMSHQKLSYVTSLLNGNTVYTSAIGAQHPIISKRVLGTDPTPPTPGPNPDQSYTSAATGDVSSALICLLVICCAISVCVVTKKLSW